MNLIISKDRILTPLGRRKTCDVAFNLRMPAGQPGDITRHFPPGTIEPCLMSSVTPIPLFGLAVVSTLDATNSVRLVQAGDNGLDAIYGVSVRPYPFQQQNSAAPASYGGVGFGGGVPATVQPVDILRSGYILVPIVGAAPVKGGRVWVWVAASGGGHVQGGFETATGGGNTIELDEKTLFQGGVDANGNGEIGFNI